MNKESKKIIQVGLGGFGKNHVRILSKLGLLKAVCDMDFEKAKEYGKKYNVPYYRSLDDLIENESFKGAVIATPTLTHKAITTKLLKAGKHCFVEKPLTFKSIDGIKLARLAKKNNLILVCGYIERFNPAVNLAKQLIKSKTHGKLLNLEFHRENRIPFHIKDVGIIFDTSVHDIDTANYLMGGFPRSVFARSGSFLHNHEDFATVVLSYDKNRVAVITSNWITPTKVRSLRAVCTDAILSLDMIEQKIEIERKHKTERPRMEKVEPLELELKHFINSMYNRRPIMKPHEAINVSHIAELALRSSEQDKQIKIRYRYE